jgi:hypothetical protein
MNKLLFCSAVAAAHAVAVGAQVQRADPADFSTKAPPLQYRSVFEGYRPFAEQEVGNWRKANEEVGAAGGHAGHGAGQSRAEKPAAKPQQGQAGKAPAAKDHGGHK